MGSYSRYVNKIVFCCIQITLFLLNDNESLRTYGRLPSSGVLLSCRKCSMLSTTLQFSSHVDFKIAIDHNSDDSDENWIDVLMLLGKLKNITELRDDTIELPNVPLTTTKIKSSYQSKGSGEPLPFTSNAMIGYKSTRGYRKPGGYVRNDVMTLVRFMSTQAELGDTKAIMDLLKRKISMNEITHEDKRFSLEEINFLATRAMAILDSADGENWLFCTEILSQLQMYGYGPDMRSTTAAMSIFIR